MINLEVASGLAARGEDRALVPRWQRTRRERPCYLRCSLPIKEAAAPWQSHECRQTTKIPSRGHGVSAGPTANDLHPTEGDSTVVAIPVSNTVCVDGVDPLVGVSRQQLK